MSVMCHCIICFNTRFLALVATDHVITAPQHDVELSIISQMAFDVILYVTLTSMFLFFNKVGSMGGFTLVRITHRGHSHRHSFCCSDCRRLVGFELGS